MTWLDDAVGAIGRHKKTQETKPLKTGKTRPLLGCCTIRARDDLNPNDSDFALPREYRLTAAADNIVTAEIVDVGESAYDKHGRSAALPWAPGDIVLVSLADVRQEFMLENENHFSCNAEAFFARLNKDNTIEASCDWVITKPNHARFSRALSGRDGFVYPETILDDGVPSGEVNFGKCPFCGTACAVDLQGKPAPVTRVVYEEITHVGPGRHVLGMLRKPDVEKGQLVAYSVDWAIPFAIAGQRHRAVHYPDIMHELCGY